MGPRVVSFNEADLIPIFNGPMGVPAIYTANETSPVTFNVIYDRPPGEMGTAFKGTTQKPEIRCMSVNVPAIQKNDTFAIEGIVYYAIDFQDDGWGVTTVKLSLTAV